MATKPTEGQPNEGENNRKVKRKVEKGWRPHTKAEPRVSLAPLDFEEALENLLAVKPDNPKRDDS